MWDVRTKLHGIMQMHNMFKDWLLVALLLTPSIVSASFEIPPGVDNILKRLFGLSDQSDPPTNPPDGQSGNANTTSDGTVGNGINSPQTRTQPEQDLQTTTDQTALPNSKQSTDSPSNISTQPSSDRVNRTTTPPPLSTVAETPTVKTTGTVAPVQAVQYTLVSSENPNLAYNVETSHPEKPISVPTSVPRQFNILMVYPQFHGPSLTPTRFILDNNMYLNSQQHRTLPSFPAFMQYPNPIHLQPPVYYINLWNHGLDTYYWSDELLEELL